mgnify:CR=1 FL=1
MRAKLSLNQQEQSKLQQIAEQFKALFDGRQDAYGTYKTDDIPREAGAKVKGKAITHMRPVTVELWQAHIEQGERIGIVPIRLDNTVRFGAIDIDEYSGLDHGKIVVRIEELKLPLILCRSKSGGAHLYCFTSEPVPAYLMREKLREFCALLGHGKNPVHGRDTEIFPKQDEINSEHDTGNWINMPYCGGVRGLCYGVLPDESAMSLEQFLQEAQRKSIGLDQLAEFKAIHNEEFKDGPPCLGCLAEEGISEGGRNKGLFAFGVYARKAFPDDWKSKVEDYNRRLIEPALDSSEVQTIIKSLNKKDYSFPCQESPIADRCNTAICRLRKFGIGPDIGELPLLVDLRKVNTSPPVWFLGVNGKTVELATDDLQNPLRFQRRCLEQINLMPPIPKKALWIKTVQDLLANVQEIEVPDDASNSGQLLYFLEKFCTGRAVTEERDELLLGRVWQDPAGLTGDNLPGARYWFNMSDFVNFLFKNNFREYKVHGIASVLKHPANAYMDPQSMPLHIKAKTRNYWSVLCESFTSQDESFSVPDEVSEEEPPF